MSCWHCPMEAEPIGPWAYWTPSTSTQTYMLYSRSKLCLGPAASCSLSFSFKCTQGQRALSPVIQFFLYLVFTVPYRHSGQKNVSFRMPSAGWRKLSRGSCSRTLGRAKQQILQLHRGLSQEISRKKIFL